MNKLLFLLSSFPLFLSFTGALPFNTTSSKAFAIQAASSAAGVKGVYMCRNANFEPSAGCKYLPLHDLITCHAWPCGSSPGHECAVTSEDLAEQWLSFGPDESVVCTLHSAAKCSTALYDDVIAFPGTGDVPRLGKTQRDAAGRGAEVTYLSFDCRGM